jgi:hypothetical protein
VGIIKAYHLEQLDGKKIAATQTNAKPFILVGGTVLLLLGAYYYREEIKTNYQKLIA